MFVVTVNYNAFDKDVRYPTTLWVLFNVMLSALIYDFIARIVCEDTVQMEVINIPCPKKRVYRILGISLTNLDTVS